jgi:hypothetical protein
MTTNLKRKYCTICGHKHIITKLYMVKIGKGTKRDSSKMVCLECPCFMKYVVKNPNQE